MANRAHIQKYGGPCNRLCTIDKKTMVCKSCNMSFIIVKNSKV